MWALTPLSCTLDLPPWESNMGAEGLTLSVGTIGELQVQFCVSQKPLVLRLQINFKNIMTLKSVKLNPTWSQSISSTHPNLRKSKYSRFCTKLHNRLPLSREFESFVQCGHPPGRFPTCCCTPRHTLVQDPAQAPVSPVICDPSDRGGRRRSLQPAVTSGCVCSSHWGGEHSPYQFTSKAVPTQTHEVYKSLSCVL